MSLRLDWCSHEAAKYAVEKWHYSRRMPMPPLVKVGAWEDAKYIGCVLFSRGANYLGSQVYGLDTTQMAELVRVALTKHSAPVSKVVALAVKMLVKHAPGLRLLVSYADPREGHVGGIYQAMNWLYVGVSDGSTEYFYQGRWQHSREIRSGAFGQQRKIADWSHLPKRMTQGKHKYLYPLDAAMRTQIEPLRKPYPKRAGSIVADAPAIQAGEGGAVPTPALQSNTTEGNDGS